MKIDNESVPEDTGPRKDLRAELMRCQSAS